MTVVATDKMEKFLNNLTVPSNALQVKALQNFREMDFPTTRNEYWKYTRLGKISTKEFTHKFEQKKELDLAKHIVSPSYLVIENGIVRNDLSQYDTAFNIKFLDAADHSATYHLDESQFFTCLNSAFYGKIISIEIAPNAALDQPLQLIFIGHGEEVMSNNRIEINARKSSQSSIIYTQLSEDGISCMDNSISLISVEENAHLTIHKLQAANNTSLSVSTEQIIQKANSTFKINTFTLSGLFVRNNINILVSGQNCETFMNGAVITKVKQHVDNHTFVDHQVPNCYSNENYKYVLDDQSTGVFNGRVIVQKDAQVINAYQNNGNILLSEQASMNSKPELEIYADDVKCSHGSTTGQLDENALFYLQTRGISLAKARKLLVSAFVIEIIESVNYEPLTTLLQDILEKEHHWDF